MITEIARNFNGNPNIVTIVTDSTLTEITTEGFLELPENVADIEALQNGEFQWTDTDLVLIAYEDGVGFFTMNSVTNSFSPNAAGSGLVISNYVEIPISSANILAMHVTPKLLIPAGGANTLHIVDRAIAVLTFNSISYAAGGNSYIQYDSTTLGAGILASTQATVPAIASALSKSFPYNAGTQQWDFPLTVNKGLYFTNATAAFTTGNSNVVLKLWYKTISVV